MNELLSNQIERILDDRQKRGINPDTDVTASNSIIAEYLISQGVKLAPVMQGDTVYVIQKATIPCDTCKHRGVGIGCCMQKCSAAEYRVYTVIVDDVSAFCKIAPNGDLILNDNVYLDKTDAQEQLPNPCRDENRSEVTA